MTFLKNRCTLCGRMTQQHCQYCDAAICPQCQTLRNSKIYCSTRHRDLDAGIGRILRRLNRSSV
ncbi:MAG TPA: hypothetical protein VL485_01760 [Ktedonobacteraceae bacterium]|jgi:hypothetical protein|nr:hypothetical protein [Ktedonobacteraceae bacterium]